MAANKRDVIKVAVSREEHVALSTIASTWGSSLSNYFRIKAGLKPLVLGGSRPSSGRKPKRTAAIDAELAKSFDDVAHGRYQTFDTAEEMLAHLDKESK
jgi:hypothetical protein